MYAGGNEKPRICVICATVASSALSNEPNQVDSSVEAFKSSWLLIIAPLAISAMSAALRLDAHDSVLEMLLQGYGALAVVLTVFLRLWPVIWRKRFRSQSVAALSWVGCGAYLGLPFWTTGAVVGGAAGLVLWILLNRLISRRHFPRMFDEGPGSVH